MAKYIHDGLLYDTDKSHLYIGLMNNRESVGRSLYGTAYNYFLIINRNYSNNTISYLPISEADLRSVLEKENDIELYEKAFGKLEEA